MKSSKPFPQRGERTAKHIAAEKKAMTKGAGPMQKPSVGPMYGGKVAPGVMKKARAK